MNAILALLVLVGFAVAAAVAIRARRRAVAAALIGEISETLNLLETHEVEQRLAHFGSDGRPAPSLPALPTLSYRADAAWMTLLGAHLTRLAASFYASAEALQGELLGLSSEAGQAERVKFASDELRRTLELGDEALRSLRDIVSRGRRGSISRA